MRNVDAKLMMKQGDYLLKTLKKLERRFNLKSKTSFLNLFDVDDPWFYEGVIGAIFMVILLPKNLSDRKTKKLETACKNSCYQYIQMIKTLPVDFQRNLRIGNTEGFLRGEYAGNNAKGLGYVVSDDWDESNRIWFQSMMEDIRWNNSFLKKL